MLRQISVIFLLMIAADPLAAADIAASLPSPSIEQCIRDNAAKVEAAVPDLNQAVDFLVQKVCAEPVAEESARQTKIMQQRNTENWKKMCDAQQSKNLEVKSGDGKSSATGVSMCSIEYMNLLNGYTGGDEDNMAYSITVSGTAPAPAVALASRLLLDLRLAHTK
jgi:hypothetical protein